MWQQRPSTKRVIELAQQLGVKHIERVEYLTAGLSNFNFKLITLSHSYLLKCYCNELPLAQLKAQTQLSSDALCPNVLGFDKRQHYALFEFIEGQALSINNQVNTPHLSSFIVLLSHFHRANITAEHKLDLSCQFMLYKEQSNYQQFKTKIDVNLALLKQFPQHLGYCHNDLVCDNILETNTGLQLIDLEYAQTNDVFFDLAALSDSLKLNEEQQQWLLTKYCDYNELKIAAPDAWLKFNAYRFIYQALCYFWYCEKGLEQQATLVYQKLILND